MKPTGATFEIRTVADFGKVPRERLPACLKEFRLCLDLHREMTRNLHTTQRVLADAGEIEHGDLIPWTLDVFRWTDDGELGVREININVVEPPSGSPPVSSSGGEK